MRNERKVAVITGASQGIGAALVNAYRDRNYRVVATARSLKPSNDDEVLAVPGDIADRRTAERVISQGMARFGRIDTLVNNAGIFIAKPFTEYTEADYAAILGVNLTGFFHITQRAVVEMEKRQSGHIVQITTTLVDSANSQVQSRKVDRKPCTAPSCRAAVCHGVLSHPSGDSSRTFMPTAVNAS